jgi:hypothetical protein
MHEMLAMPKKEVLLSKAIEKQARLNLALLL